MKYIDTDFYIRHKKIIMLKQNTQGHVNTQVFDFNVEKDRDEFESHNIKDHILFKFDLYYHADFYINGEKQEDLIKVDIIKSIF